MAVLSYLFLVALLRLTGKRTLTKMNAFDFIITVAFGSTFASVLLDKSVSYAEAAVAFTMLVLMQFAVTFASTRSRVVEGLVKNVPSLLVWRGRMREEAMERARVTEAEVLAACRQEGVHALDEVEALVLETTGEFSVLTAVARRGPSQASTLRTVEGIAEAHR